MPALNDVIREAKKRAFVTALSMTGVISHACSAAGMSHTTYRRWRDDDGDFAEATQEAFAIAADAVELEARRRAMDGHEEPVVHMGHQTYCLNADGSLKLDENFDPIPFVVHRKSDRLLEIMLKAKKPAFRDKSDLTLLGADGGPIKSSVTVEFVKPDKDEEEKD